MPKSHSVPTIKYMGLPIGLRVRKVYPLRAVFRISSASSLVRYSLLWEIETDPDGSFRIHHESFVRRIDVLPPGFSFPDSRLKRQDLGWLVNTRPELDCAVNAAAQMSKEKFFWRDIINTNKVVSSAKFHHGRGSIQQKLGLETIKLVMYYDAASVKIQIIHLSFV